MNVMNVTERVQEKFLYPKLSNMPHRQYFGQIESYVVLYPVDSLCLSTFERIIPLAGCDEDLCCQRELAVACGLILPVANGAFLNFSAQDSKFSRLSEDCLIPPMSSRSQLKRRAGTFP